MVKLRVVFLVGAWGLSALACTGKGGSSTTGTAGTGAGTAGTGGGGASGSGGAAPGTAGTVGSTGTAGTTGTTGTAGTTGTTGTAGSGAGGSGAGGTSGSAGATGSGGGRGGANGGAGAGGASADPCATALFCDDFEKYTTGQPPTSPWTRQVNPTGSTGSTVAVDTAQFRSGTKSVKFVAAAGSGSKTAYIRLMSTSVLPVMPNMFYGRMMFRLEAAPTGDVHWTFLQGYGVVPGSSPSYHALYRYGGQHPVMNGTAFVGNQLMANYETPDSYSGTGPRSDCWKHATRVVVPEGRWACAEWQFDGTSNTMRFWLDGAAVDSLTVMGSGEGCGTATPVWTAPNFERMDLGWESYQQDTARTIWIDDVVLSKTKIGCPQ